MSNLTFSFDLAYQLYNSSEKFPVDFDDAWQWMEYSTKGNAKRFLEKNFKEGEDYRVIRIDKAAPEGGLTYRLDIFLTVNCFKEMGMMAGTEKGREIRQHFIRCEEKLKELLQSQIQSASQQPAIAPEVEAAREIDEIYTRLADKNPRIAQLLVDSRMNRFMGQAALPGTAEVWKGAVEIAEDLGFKTNHKNRGTLGRHVKERVGHLGKTEKRLCNGTNQPIMLYPDTDEVKNAVKTFFVTPIGSKQG